MALQTTPGGLASAKAGAGAAGLPVPPSAMPGSQPDPYERYHPQHPPQNSTREVPQFSIPHFNSRGELIPFPESQVIRIYDTIIPFLLLEHPFFYHREL